MDSTDSSVLQHCQQHVEYLLANSPIYSHLLSKIRITSASRGHVFVHLELEPIHVNSKGGLHGSVTATLVDFIGGVAIASYDNRSNTGVSTDINISYIGLARVGDTIEIEGKAMKVGGSLAYTTATIRKVQEYNRLGEGEIIAIGSHTKYVKQK